MSANYAYTRHTKLQEEHKKQLQNKPSVADFLTQCDNLYIDAMAYIIKITLDPEIEDSHKMTAIGEVIANLYNAIIRLDPIRGEKELSKYDRK